MTKRPRGCVERLKSYTKKSVQLWAPGMFTSKGGIEVFSKNLLLALRRNSCEVTVHVKNDSPNDSSLNSPDIISYGMKRGRFQTGYYILSVLMAAIVKRPKLIIMTHINMIPVACILSYIVRCKYWVVIHGVEAWNERGVLYKHALKRADKVLPVSRYSRDRLDSWAEIRNRNTSLIFNTVDLDIYKINEPKVSLKKKYKIPDSNKIILTVNRLSAAESYRGYDILLSKYNALLERYPNVTWIIAGKGDDMNRLKREIDQKKLENYVILAGYVPDDEIVDYYNGCDMFVMPSKLEGFGIVYLEAMACGKACLAGNQDGATDALCDGEIGILVDPYDADEIIDKIVEYLEGNNPNKLLYDPIALRNTVREKFAFERFVECFKRLLDEQFAQQ